MKDQYLRGVEIRLRKKDEGGDEKNLRSLVYAIPTWILEWFTCIMLDNKSYTYVFYLKKGWQIEHEHKEPILDALKSVGHNGAYVYSSDGDLCWEIEPFWQDDENEVMQESERLS